MPTANFKLRGSSANSSKTITLIFRFQDTNLKYSTGFKTTPDHWNPERQELRNRADVRNRESINSSLLQVKSDMFKAYESLQVKGEVIDTATLRRAFDELRGTVTKETPVYVSQYLKRFIEEAPDKTVRKAGGQYSPLKDGTLKKYRALRRQLQDFERLHSVKVKFSDLDLKFHSTFLKHLETENSNNTIGTRIKALKRLCRLAKQEGAEVHPMTFERDFFAPTEKSYFTYLNEKEINDIFELDLSDNIRLDNIRDLFIIGLWTGLRISDLKRITKADIKEGYIHIEETQKTGVAVVIPIHHQVKATLTKRDGEIPNIISDQKFNEYVKEVCQLAKLTQAVKGSKRGENNRKVTGNFPKYELITSHTCRRSFATNLFYKMPSQVIMAITGHQDEKTFLKYVQKTQKDNAEKVKLLWAKEVKEQNEKQNLKAV